MTPIYKVTLMAEPSSPDHVSLSELDALMKKGLVWLCDTGRTNDMLNFYINDERGITFVFSDATTATLFRLAH